MNRILTSLSIAIIALFFAKQNLYAQTYKWVKGGGSTNAVVAPYEDEQVKKMCTDANGNVYALGVMANGTMVADTFHRSSGYGTDANVFLASYNCAGQMRWAKLIGSPSNNKGYDIVADNHGHIYVAGRFTHVGGSNILHVGYDTSFSTNPYISSGVIQYDTSGEFNWIRLLGDNTTASVTALGGTNCPLVVDGSDNVHFICNAGYGAHIIPSILTHFGNYDVTFDGSGTILSVLKLQQDTTLAVDGAALDKTTGKLYVFGVKQTTFSSVGSLPYVAAFDVSRNQIWADTLLDPIATFPPGVAFTDIIADSYGNLYLTAGAQGMMVYRHDTAVNALSSGATIATVMKMNTSGDLSWIRTFSGTLTTNGLSRLTLMPNNKVAAIGGMLGQVASGSYSITSYAGETNNSYFTILDSAGYVHTLQQIHGAGNDDWGYAITADKMGSLYLGGALGFNVWNGSLTPYTSVGGNTDFYVMKYGVDCSCTTMPVANYTVTGGTTKTFTYTGTTAGIDSVRWNFGDGGTSAILNPTHPYTYGDTFTACVTVYTSCGSDMHCSDFIIPCVTAPTASYSSSGGGLVKTFTYLGIGLGTGTVSWTFGDGTPAVSGLTVTHTFSGTGTYNVCVTATNSCGSNMSCTTITVTCTTGPVSAFTISGAGASRSFTYTGTTAGLDSVTWSFGDGGNATGLTTSHTYATTGVKNVCATVYTNCGTNTICHTVTINCITAIAAAFTDTGNLVHGFTYTGTTADLDSVGWDYGDSHKDTGKHRVHTYSAAGTYHVCVILYTDCGNDTVCRDVVIHPLGIDALAFSDIKVFPNPATNELTITGIQDATSYRIMTVTGVNLQTGILQTGSNIVMLPGISAGIYLLEMTGLTGEKNTIRFIRE